MFNYYILEVNHLESKSALSPCFPILSNASTYSSGTCGMVLVMFLPLAYMLRRYLIASIPGSRRHALWSPD